MATDLNEIVRIAALGIQKSKDALEEFARAMELLPDRDQGSVIVAMKLLDGQKYQISSDAPANVDRVVELAQAIGAEVDISETDDGLTRITFTPAARQ